MNKPPRTLAIAAALLLGCSTGSYVWVDEYKPPSAVYDLTREYVIAPGDIVSVRVFNQDQMSARERVRSDGRVSLPFLNDVTAAGMTPKALGAQLQTRLRDYINNPIVTVAVDEPRGVPVSVAGEVSRPGLYSVEPGAGVLQALVLAGGLNEFAGRDRLYVLRPQGGPLLPPLRIRFHYWSLVRAEGQAPLFQLRPGDTIVAE